MDRTTGQNTTDYQQYDQQDETGNIAEDSQRADQQEEYIAYDHIERPECIIRACIVEQSSLHHNQCDQQDAHR